MAKGGMIPVMAIIITIVTIALGSVIGLAMVAQSNNVFQAIAPGNSYRSQIDSNVVVVSTSNATTLTFGRVVNGSVTVTLNQTNYFGLTTPLSSNYTLTSLGTISTGGVLTFNSPCLNTTKTYLCTITYTYDDLQASNGNLAWNNTASTIYSSWPLLGLVVLALIGSAVLFSIMVFR
jgi:hypothetical protein